MDMLYKCNWVIILKELTIRYFAGGSFPKVSLWKVYRHVLFGARIMVRYGLCWEDGIPNEDGFLDYSIIIDNSSSTAKSVPRASPRKSAGYGRSKDRLTMRTLYPFNSCPSVRPWTNSGLRVAWLSSGLGDTRSTSMVPFDMQGPCDWLLLARIHHVIQVFVETDID